MKNFTISIKENGEIQKYTKKFRDLQSAKDFLIENQINFTNIEEEKESFFLSKIEKIFSKQSDIEVNRETELEILATYAEAKHIGCGEKEALEEISISSDDPKIRKIFDILNSYKGGYSHIYDIFIHFPNIFSENTLNILKIHKDRGAKIPVEKLISNSKERITESMLQNVVKGGTGIVYEVEGYVETERNIGSLWKEIKSSVKGPLVQLAFVIGITLGVTIFLVPFFLESASKFGGDIEEINFHIISESLILASNFIINYGLFFFFFLLFIIILFGIYYNISLPFKRKVHIFLLSIPYLSYILKMFYTKKIFSLLLVFAEANMKDRHSYESAIELTPFIPMKEELTFWANNIVESIEYEKLFLKIPPENRYFMRSVYVFMPKYADNRRGHGGNKIKGFDKIVKQADWYWKEKLSLLPGKLKNIILGVNIAITVYFIAGTLLIIQVVYNAIKISALG